jgi:hypothetical protein
MVHLLLFDLDLLLRSIINFLIPAMALPGFNPFQHVRVQLRIVWHRQWLGQPEVQQKHRMHSRLPSSSRRSSGDWSRSTSVDLESLYSRRPARRRPSSVRARPGPLVHKLTR